LSNPARELGTESSILSGGCRRRARLPHAARIENTQEKKPVQEEEVDEIEVMLNPEHWQAEVERLRQEGLPNCRMLRGLKQTGRKGETRTVNDLRQQICKLMHLEDFRMVRLLLWKRSCTPASWQPGEAESFAEMAGCAYSETGGKASVTCLTPSTSLSLYDFRNAFIEVKKRKRGGKKPGNGWYRDRRRTCFPQQVVGMLGRDTAFARTHQRYTCIEDSKPWEKLLRVLDVLQGNAIVLCGGRGVAAALQLQLVQCGARISDAGIFTAKGFRFALAVEEECKAKDSKPTLDFVYDSLADCYHLQPFVDVADLEDSDDGEEGQGNSVGRGKGHGGKGMSKGGQGMSKGGQGKGKGSSKGSSKGNGTGTGKGNDGKGEPGGGDGGQNFAEYTVKMPELNNMTPSFVVVYGRLHEGASLAALLERISPFRSRLVDLHVLHFASDTQSVLIETEEERHELSLILNGNQLTDAINVGGVKLSAKYTLTAPTPEALRSGELPMICSFKLRVMPLGYIVQMRKSFCYDIPEIFPAAVDAILEAADADAKVIP